MDSMDLSYARASAAGSRRASDAFSTTSSTPSSVPSIQSRSAFLADPFQDKEQSTASTTTAMPNPKSDDRPLEAMVGQFSSTPAIQTTVVTTTTTTTTSFPPLLMKAPRHLHDLDPELYPLAATPTPPALKKIRFEHNGQTTIFTEAEDPQATQRDFGQQQKRIQDAQGSIRSVSQFKSNALGTSYDPNLRPYLRLKYQPDDGRTSSSRHAQHSMDMTPPSTGPAKTRRQKTLERERQALGIPSSSYPSESSRPTRSSSKLQFVQTSTPVTPFADARVANRASSEKLSRGSRNSRASPSPEVAEAGEPSPEPAQTLSPQPEASLHPEEEEGDDEPTEQRVPRETSLSTPPVESARMGPPSPGASTLRPRPSALDTTAAQDASLPSPSLSPVTAAATLQSRRSYFDDSMRKDLRTSLGRQAEHGLGLWGTDVPETQNTLMTEESDEEQGAQFSMMDIPKMLSSFEALPGEMKSYVMYQFLRRCPKPVLHCVADAVNPALKCDFLALLPLELSQLIIGHLDLRSLCRASQVSKKWRQIVDSDEKTWKNLFDDNGYSLGPGELRRAILEGWGWQHVSKMDSAEQDLGNFRGSVDPTSPAPSGIITLLSSPNAEDHITEPASSHGRRSKRKTATKSRYSSRKSQKRKETPSRELALYDNDALNRHLESSEGPFAAARAAKIAVPMTNKGLSSLRNMKLYKSIYRRHHFINKTWMQDDIQPRHLAFRAHSRHVVTCLEFDSEKVLTGSDDTNICVYDTRTGTLRSRLTGHEGGVWALKYEDNMLVSGSTDRSVRVWNIDKGLCMHTFHGHTSTVRCLLILKPAVIGRTEDGKPIIMPKEPLIITGSRDSTLRVWKLPKPEDEPTGMGAAMLPHVGDESPYFVRQLAGHGHSVRAIAAHGDTLVSGSYDHFVRVWKISTGETLHRLAGHNQKVYSVVLDHERNRCISGSMDNLVKIWSLETGNVLYNLEGHTSLVGLLDLQRDRLVSAAADSTLRIWDPNTGHCRSVLKAHTGAITCFQHDGNKVISGSDRTLKMWDVQTGKLVRDLLKDLTGVWQVKFDERHCVAAVQRNNMTYIEILDFGASRDGVSSEQLGQRIVVDAEGHEIRDEREIEEAAEADV